MEPAQAEQAGHDQQERAERARERRHLGPLLGPAHPRADAGVNPLQIASLGRVEVLAAGGLGDPLERPLVKLSRCTATHPRARVALPNAHGVDDDTGLSGARCRLLGGLAGRRGGV